MDFPNADIEFAGFGVKGYRSLYGELRLLGPLRKVNLVAGQNNSGKSNFLRFASLVLSSKDLPALPPVTGLDVPLGDGVDNAFEFAIGIRVRDDYARKLTERIPHGEQQLRHLLQHPAMRWNSIDEVTWLRFELVVLNSGKSVPRISEALCHEVSVDTPPNLLSNLANGLTNTYSQAGTQNASLVLNYLFTPINYMPKVHLIDAFRQISAEDGSPNLVNGAGLIKRLAKLQRPEIDQQPDKKRFAEINQFVKSVLDDSSAQLDIPNSLTTIHVERNGPTLPLESLGTGVHQVIIIAAAATTVTNSIVCIEEPEVHLHPLLQRKLVRYLKERTSNQYIIATHSAHLLDYATSAVFHVHLGNRGTEIERAEAPQAVADLCADLGYRPSDLLQANSVIWVEGPSDRLYIRAWLNLVAPELIEGIHFSIMFYGGRLLNHLTSLDPEVDDFISLRRLNRQSVVIIDSDRSNPHQAINPTKRRVRDEYRASGLPGFAWVTDCRTIENYIPESVKRAGLTIAQPRLRLTSKGTKWEDPLNVKTSQTPVDKIKLAQAIASLLTLDDMNLYDLRRMVSRLAAFVRDANGDAVQFGASRS